jgi:hypothetical protein
MGKGLAWFAGFGVSEAGMVSAFEDVGVGGREAMLPVVASGGVEDGRGACVLAGGEERAP